MYVVSKQFYAHFVWVGVVLATLLCGISTASAQNACTVAQSQNVIAQQVGADPGTLYTGVFFQDVFNGTVNIPLNGNQANTQYGTQTAVGNILIDADLRYGNSSPGGYPVTFELRVNGATPYLRLQTTLGTGTSGAAINATLTPLNGATVNGNSAAFTFTANSFLAAPNNFARLAIVLPASITSISSLSQYFLASAPSGQGADDITFRVYSGNQCRSRLRLQKVIGSPGRFAGTDQFSLSIVGTGAPAAVTTAGTGTTVTGSIDFPKFTNGTNYTFAEAASGTTVLGSYTKTYACTNVSTGTGTALPSGTGTSFVVTPRSGDDITCVITNTPLPATVINLRKSTVGGFGGAFGFTLTNTTQTTGTVTTAAAATLTPVDGNAGAAGIQPFTVATAGAAVSINESTIPAGWALRDMSCSDSVSGPITLTNAGTTYTIPGTATVLGRTINCTVTNDRLGSITIVKDARPNNAQDFAFTTTGTGLSNFSLDDDADAVLPNTRVFSNLAPGSYSVTEGAIAGWVRANLLCVDPDSGSTVSVASGVATIDLDAGEAITCTYTNDKLGRLTVTKTTLGGGSQFDFTTTGALVSAFSLNPPGSGGTVSNPTFTNVAIGSDITITEVLSGGAASFTLADINCSDNPGGANGSVITENIAGKAVTVNLVAGADVNCTFINTKNVDIAIIKSVVGGNGTFNYTVSTGGAPVITTTGGTGAVNSSVSVPNSGTVTFSITEAAAAGFQLQSIVCTATSGSLTTTSTALPTVNLSATAGTVGSCTFTNIRRPTVTVRKLSQGGIGTFGFAGGSNGLESLGSFNLATTLATNPVSAPAVAVTSVTAATSITEATIPSGWVLSGWECTTASSIVVASGSTATMTIPASVMDDGNDLTCTFTNIKQPILRLQKALPSGRIAATDQFALTISGTGGPATVTTSGSGSTATGVAVISPATSGSVYNLSEVGASGANLSNYTTTYSCNNTLSGGQAPSGSGSNFSVSPVAGDDLTCTLSNTRAQLADLSITKTNTPGANGEVDQAADTVVAGATTNYTIVVRNNGPDSVTGAVIRDPSVASLNCASLTCTGTACPVGATVNDLQTSGIVLGTLPNAATVTVVLSCTVAE